MDAKLAVLTGANGGIGRKVAHRLAADGWSLVLVLRDPAQRSGLQNELSTSLVECVVADLADHRSIARAAAEISERWPAIDLLVHGAGVQLGSRENSPQGIEMHFEVNALGPYQLTRRLLDPLAAGDGMVLTVGSRGMLHTRRLDVDRLVDPTDMRPLFGAYTQSKYAVAAIMRGLAPEVAERDIVLRLCCPGPTKTAATTGPGMPRFLKPIRAVAFQSPEKAAANVMKALDPRFGRETGLYIQGGKAHPLPDDALDPDVQKRLLVLCGELTGV
ncbi:MAG: SDR family NAD(P)-dependent oxidoreductase [Marmoricola sp.]